MPAPSIDLAAKFNHLNDFPGKLRLKVFFNNRNGAVADEALDQELDKMPWEQMSTFSPTPGENEALENLLVNLHHIYSIHKTEMSLKTICQGQRGGL